MNYVNNLVSNTFITVRIGKTIMSLLNIKTKTVYLITTIDNDTYITVSSESPDKILRRVRNNDLASIKSEVVDIELLGTADSYNISKLRKYYINKYKPTLNILKPKRTTGVSIVYKGEVYPSLREVWSRFGTVPYGTFKSRYHTLKRPLERCL